MEYLRKIIEKDLKNMTESERNIYRKASLLTFQNLTEELIARSEEFEERILDSVKTTEGKTTIYTALVHKEKFYLYEEEMFPIIKNNKNLGKIMENEGEKIVGTVFVKRSYSDIMKLNGRELSGFIKAGESRYMVSVKMEIDNRYREKMEELYSVFLLNDLKWRTINQCYSEKMFKLVITDHDEELYYANTDAFELEIFYEELTGDVYPDYDLMWNIREKEAIGDSLVRAMEDRIHYEHKIKFEQIEEAYLYPSSDNIFLAHKDEEFMYIITDDIKENKWIIWKIKELTDKRKYENLEFPLSGNEKEYDFLNRLRSNSIMRIRSEAEIERIAGSFPEIKKAVKYKDYYITEKDLGNTIKTYDMNSFIIDEFRLKGKKERLYVYFELLDNNYLSEDMVSFMVSEMQIYFPEYECVGVEYGREV